MIEGRRYLLWWGCYTSRYWQIGIYKYKYSNTIHGSIKTHKRCEFDDIMHIYFEKNNIQYLFLSRRIIFVCYQKTPRLKITYQNNMHPFYSYAFSTYMYMYIVCHPFPFYKYVIRVYLFYIKEWNSTPYIVCTSVFHSIISIFYVTPHALSIHRHVCIIIITSFHFQFKYVRPTPAAPQSIWMYTEQHQPVLLSIPAAVATAIRWTSSYSQPPAHHNNT